MIQEKVESLLKVKDDPVVQFTIGMVTDEVLNHCNLNVIPKKLENVVVMMCVDAIKQCGMATTSQDDTGNVKSIKEGDTSIQYISSVEMVLERIKNPSFIFNYTTHLNRFRRLRV